VGRGGRGAGRRCRVLGYAPAPDDGGDAERGDDPGQGVPAGGGPAGGEQGHDGQAAASGGDHQRQCPAGEPGVQDGAGGVQLGQGRQRQGPGDDGGGLGAVGEVALQAPVAAAGGLADQVDGGQVAAGGDEQEPGQQGGGAGPGGQAGVAGDGGGRRRWRWRRSRCPQQRGPPAGEGERRAGGPLGRQPA